MFTHNKKILALLAVSIVAPITATPTEWAKTIKDTGRETFTNKQALGLAGVTGLTAAVYTSRCVTQAATNMGIDKADLAQELGKTTAGSVLNKLNGWVNTGKEKVSGLNEHMTQRNAAILALLAVAGYGYKNGWCDGLLADEEDVA